MTEKCEDEGIDDDALLKYFPPHQYRLIRGLHTKMEKMIVSSLSDLMGEGE